MHDTCCHKRETPESLGGLSTSPWIKLLSLSAVHTGPCVCAQCALRNLGPLRKGRSRLDNTKPAPRSSPTHAFKKRTSPTNSCAMEPEPLLLGSWPAYSLSCTQEGLQTTLGKSPTLHALAVRGDTHHSNFSARCAICRTVALHASWPSGHPSPPPPLPPRGQRSLSLPQKRRPGAPPAPRLGRRGAVLPGLST